jgi:DNA-binding transcriptional regulator YiaG
MSSSKPAFVVKKGYIQVTLPGSGPFSLTEDHPTFNRLKKALKEKNWKLVPKLVTTAQSIQFDSGGLVTIKKDGVYYKDQVIHSSLSDRIMQLVQAGKPVKYLVNFMNKIQQNPAPEARTEFYDWLVNNELPITSDGNVICYKSVHMNNTDTRTGTIDNSPGQVIMMPRNVADPNWRTQCSSGFHVCSKQYGVYGEKTMAVLVNPKDVLSANSGKMRVVKYEVLKELGSKDDRNFRLEGFTELEKQLVIEIKKERKELVQLLLTSKDVKRAIKNKKISIKTIMKYPYARLKSMVQKYDLIPSVGPESNHSLESARKAAGLTQGELARKMNVTLKEVVKLEQSENPAQKDIDKYLRSISDLVGIRDLSRSAITYPKALAVAK